MASKYCCNNRCFEVPRCQVDGLACSFCNSYCYCKCKCEEVKKKIINLSNIILKKASNIKNEGLIGVKIYRGKGYIATNCEKINSPVETIYDNYFYLYTNNSMIIVPGIDVNNYKYIDPHKLLVKTNKSSIYVFDM